MACLRQLQPREQVYDIVLPHRNTACCRMYQTDFRNLLRSIQYPVLTVSNSADYGETDCGLQMESWKPVIPTRNLGVFQREYVVV